MIGEDVVHCVARDIATCYALAVEVDVLTQVGSTVGIFEQCIATKVAPVQIPSIENSGHSASVTIIGVFTPVICSISAAVQVFLTVHAHGPDPFQFSFSFSVTAALFLLGPGAFSVDSRLFGRRLIVHSDGE